MKVFSTTVIVLCVGLCGGAQVNAGPGEGPDGRFAAESPGAEGPDGRMPDDSGMVVITPPPAPETPAPTPKAPTGDRTITKVVKLLREMLEDSRKEGKTERDLYAKYKCYCDDNEQEKKDAIKSGKKQIATLEAKIEELSSGNGELSVEVADLKKRMDENEAARGKADKLREEENKAYLELKGDLEQGIKDLDAAIKVLEEVNADQTASSGAADHKLYMADYDEKKAALLTTRALMSTSQAKLLDSFIQAPFTETYTSQSAEIMGILKDMKDTFDSDLKQATKKEEDAVKAHGEYTKNAKEAFDEMKKSYDEKQGKLGGNDKALGTTKSQLTQAKTKLGEDEDFLAKLLTLCKDKSDQYNERLLLRKQEQAAISEAIAILDSDAAFASFAKTDATLSGATSFLQRRLESHDSRQEIRRLLRQTANFEKSPILRKAASLLEGTNPFAVVLEEIGKMLTLIAEEGKQDKENLDWCKEERRVNNENLAEKKKQITQLEIDIGNLDSTINDPEKGLKFQISETEKSLVENADNQKTQTTERKKENIAYQTDIGNLVNAEDLLEKAIKVLTDYYDAIRKEEEKASLLQAHEEPAPPKTFDDDYTGQSTKGNKAISMLQFILAETKKEEDQAHKDEQKAQTDYEDAMEGLKKEQNSLETSLATLQQDLAKAEADLLEKKDDLKTTTAEKEAIEAYLLKIKPGCDFITDNFDLRESNRATEKTALEKAQDLIEKSPHHEQAVHEKKVEGFGKCKPECLRSEVSVECKACLAKVEIPAYCAGHPETPGCD